MNTNDARGLLVKCPNCGASYIYLPEKIAEGGFFQCQNCAKWLHAQYMSEQDRFPVVSLAVEKEAAAHERRSHPKKDFQIRRDIPTMFLHGLLFSLIMVGLLWIWFYIIEIGTFIGGSVGFYVGFAVSCAGIVGVVGYTDTILVQLFWDVYCEKSWRSIIGHGVIMSVLVVLGALPAIITWILFPHQPWETFAIIETILIVLLWGTIGIIGRSVAYLFAIDRRSQSGEGSGEARTTGHD
ncbi:MAG: hypothetical protein C4K49_07840 [Candidatus Thorarchaeota archaeon]|nr:MAG: hypothetical protein C4K49_07840 [Candidatus Thorarchaeota archaeon]